MASSTWLNFDSILAILGGHLGFSLMAFSGCQPGFSLLACLGSHPGFSPMAFRVANLGFSLLAFSGGHPGFPLLDNGFLGSHPELITVYA